MSLCQTRLELYSLTLAAHISKWNEASLKAYFLSRRQWGFCRQILCASNSIWRWPLEHSLVFYLEERPTTLVHSPALEDFAGLFHSPRSQHKRLGRLSTWPSSRNNDKINLPCAFHKKRHLHYRPHLTNNPIKGTVTTKWILSRKSNMLFKITGPWILRAASCLRAAALIPSRFSPCPL